ncbi:hypothetical protein HPB47_006370, partial [Ixodes persulcatus]
DVMGNIAHFFICIGSSLVLLSSVVTHQPTTKYKEYIFQGKVTVSERRRWRLEAPHRAPSFCEQNQPQQIPFCNMTAWRQQAGRARDHYEQSRDRNCREQGVAAKGFSEGRAAERATGRRGERYCSAYSTECNAKMHKPVEKESYIVQVAQVPNSPRILGLIVMSLLVKTYQVSWVLFLMMTAFAFAVISLLILISAMGSLSGGTLMGTLFYLNYHIVGFIFYLSGGLTCVINASQYTNLGIVIAAGARITWYDWFTRGLRETLARHMGGRHVPVCIEDLR